MEKILPLDLIATLLTKHPGTLAGMNLMGTFLFGFSLARRSPGEPGQRWVVLFIFVLPHPELSEENGWGL
ncbi:MAG: hypothetical protein ACT4OJ_03790 [Bacteroidota bacterium]